MTVAVKICGLTNLDDARVALEAGADFLEFVLYPGSPRHVTAAGLAEIVGELPEAALAPRPTHRGTKISVAPASPSGAAVTISLGF